ncbi:SAM-dependent methyltransferase, partial [Saccharopolyspora cebuensis]|uniref:SAM-dependent methyltransferase n=1 Tax=Saccharopolyspora cebuensis TaxID=418759 RepID=UPI0031ECCE85
ANRAFLRRAVRYCLEDGITQFLDLGSGIPTVGNVHEVALAADERARVVYVDNEPVAVAHTRRLLEGEPRAAMVHADLRDTEAVLGAPEVTELLDFDRPVALLLVAALHYVGADDDPDALLARYTAALPPGSALVVSQVTMDQRDPDEVAEILEIFARTATPLTMRSRSEIRDLVHCAGWELVEPGLVWSPEWHPDSPPDAQWPPAASNSWAGVARR